MHAHNFKDLTGRRFGRWVVVNQVDNYRNGRANCAKWLCRCDCGTTSVRPSSVLLRGKSKSCGCWAAELSGLARRLPDGVAAVNLNINKYKYCAKKRGLSWALSDLEVQRMMSMSCYYCGQEPQQIIRHINWSAKRPSLLYNGIDRVDNLRGYESSNVVPCCKVCNLAKHTMPQQDFISWAKRVANHCENRTHNSESQGSPSNVGTAPLLL